MTTRRHLLLTAAAAAAAAATVRPSQAQAADDMADFLFVQTADAMTFDKATSKLTLEGVGATTLFFSDRPERIAGNMDTAAFIPFWSKGADSFLSDPPNADLSLVKAWKADESGNVVFRKTARNFNVPAATCGKVCVVEVEEIVPTGSLDPDGIHLPGVYVQRLVLGAPYDKKIEFRTTRARENA